ncbi:uncharacterized protein EDB93DRAFT_1108427 [Suillus bovinus]|uniref:uncharacterized protein n=1 Tax=Suillus bovinus TaxID=48563 RepID=UPI001B884FEE|nr:uncharacterized protein EDB93DRAFT_1108427 [Suillus bovinus]KAG2130312.1 hypothetical protein EDB93DRAFT_1108427 [Suillus bovinus]
MSDRSSNGSTHSLRSQGTLEAAAASGTSRKAPAVWSKAEETAFLEFLLKALPSSGDGGFKMPTFNQAATHLKEKFTQQRGAEKTGLVCKNKWTTLKKAYHSVIEIKCTSGFTWSDEHGVVVQDADNAHASSSTRKRTLSSATDPPAPKKAAAMCFFSPLDTDEEDEDEGNNPSPPPYPRRVIL